MTTVREPRGLEMSGLGVDWKLLDDVAIVTVDDGKANALSQDLIASVNSALDEVEALGRACRAIMLAGRPGFFSAGFDLKAVRGASRAAVNDLATSGGELVRR